LHAEPLERPRRAVGAPAGGLVEAARARVVPERPEDPVLPGLRELLLRTRQQRAAGSDTPARGVDVEAVQLAEPVGERARPGRRPAEQTALVLGDEADVPRLRTAQRLGPARPVDRHRVEVGGWEDVPVGRLPAADADALD